MTRTLTTQDIRMREWARANLDQVCAICGADGTEEDINGNPNPLEADHIRPYATYPELRYVHSNFQMLCRYHNRRKGKKDMKAIEEVRLTWFDIEYIPKGIVDLFLRDTSSRHDKT